MTTKRSREAIAVSIEAKAGLDSVNDQLQKLLGLRLSYNDIISYLLVQYNKSGPNNQLDMFDNKYEEPIVK